MGPITFLLPNGVTCSNTYFNKNVPEMDLHTLDTKTVAYGDDVYDEELWKKISSEKTLELYEDSQKVFFVAIEMRIDESDEIFHVLNKNDTDSGKFKKKQANREKRRLKKIAVKKLQPVDNTTAENETIVNGTAANGTVNETLPVVGDQS